MGHLCKNDSLREARERDFIFFDLLSKCFDYDERESYLNLREYLESYEYVLYKGVEIGPSLSNFYLKESSQVPEEYLEEAYDLQEQRGEAIAWLRMWSNYVLNYNDLVNGFPGGSYEFSSTEVEERWKEMSQGEAFANLEGRILAYNLLRN